MHTAERAVKQGEGERFQRDSPGVVADLGIYGTNFNPYDVGAPFGLSALYARYAQGNVRFEELRRQGKSIAEANRIAGTNFRPGGLRGIGGKFRSAGRAVTSVAKAAAPIVVPIVQHALKLSGPIGMIASGAAGALGAVVRGEGLEGIAWAAAEGASPPGIDRVVGAAKALREGKPVLTVALSQARQQFAPGSIGQRAFDVGVSAAKNGSKGVLNSARQQLKTATEKAAFDAALGTVSKAAKGMPTNPMVRPDVLSLASRVRRPLTGYRHPSTELALSVLRRQPALRRMSLGDLSRRMNLPARHVADARGLFDDEGLSAYDTGALGDPGGTYILRSGDTGSGLARRFTGDANRWRELPAANKRGMGSYTGSKDMVVQQIKDPKTGKIKTTLLNPFYSGLVINVPPGWGGPGIVTTAPPAAPTPVPGPVPGPTPVILPPEIIVGDAPAPKPPATIPNPIPGAPPIAMPPGLPPVPQTIPQGVPGAPPPGTTIPGIPPGLPGTVPISTGAKKEDGAGLALGLAAAGLLLM